MATSNQDVLSVGGAAGDSRNLHVAVGSAVRTIGIGDDVRVQAVRTAADCRHNVGIIRIAIDPKAGAML